MQKLCTTSEDACLCRGVVFHCNFKITVHGLKSTLLSWASQLRLDPELRRLQGHHKDPLTSTRLYSRDDIDGAIFLQQSIVDKVLDGWRPHTPLARGGQVPLTEPPVFLESFKKGAPEFSCSSLTLVLPQISP